MLFGDLRCLWISRGHDCHDLNVLHFIIFMEYTAYWAIWAQRTLMNNNEHMGPDLNP